MDRPVRLGTVSLAAICKTEVHANIAQRAVMASCSKKPLLILVVRDEVAIGLDLHGNRLSADEVEAIYPGAIKGLMAELGAPSS